MAHVSGDPLRHGSESGTDMCDEQSPTLGGMEAEDKKSKAHKR